MTSLEAQAKEFRGISKGIPLTTMHPYVREMLCIINNWPRQYAEWNDAPAEFGVMVMHLLCYDQETAKIMHAMSLLRGQSDREYERLKKASFG